MLVCFEQIRKHLLIARALNLNMKVIPSPGSNTDTPMNCSTPSDLTTRFFELLAHYAPTARDSTTPDEEKNLPEDIAIVVWKVRKLAIRISAAMDEKERFVPKELRSRKNLAQPRRRRRTPEEMKRFRENAGKVRVISTRSAKVRKKGAPDDSHFADYVEEHRRDMAEETGDEMVVAEEQAHREHVSTEREGSPTRKRMRRDTSELLSNSPSWKEDAQLQKLTKGCYEEQMNAQKRLKYEEENLTIQKEQLALQKEFHEEQMSVQKEFHEEQMSFQKEFYEKQMSVLKEFHIEQMSVQRQQLAILKQEMALQKLQVGKLKKQEAQDRKGRQAEVVREISEEKSLLLRTLDSVSQTLALSSKIRLSK